MDNENPSRLLIVGLDGLSWQLLAPLLDAGVMPHLDRLRREGAHGPLTSVVPTQSAAAWASFITGQNPARHGVLDFVLRQADGRYRHAKPHPEATLWHHAGRAGLRVGVFNFPVTYPPDPVNGFLVSGMLSPQGRTFTYPPGLGDELLSAVPGYRLDLEWQLYAGREGALLRDLTEMTRQRALAGRYLQARYPSDLLAVAFVGPDRLQHALWRHLDPTHPHHSPNEAARLAGDLYRFYATLDEALGQLVAGAGDGAAVIVLSDHGFQSAAWQFRVDEWLTQRGWLAWQAGRSRLERWVRKMDAPWVRHVRRRLVKDISRHFPTFSPGGAVDWSRTAAFCPWTEQQGIRLNVKDREPDGIVSMSAYEPLREEIRHALLETTDPHSGQKVVDRVWRREELYEGPFFDQMPDLVFTLRPGFASSPTQQRLWSATGWASGDHSLEGILVAWGPGVTPGPVAGAELISVAPTALYLLDQPVPAGMDGKVLTRILTAPFLASHPLRFADVPPEGRAGARRSQGEGSVGDLRPSELDGQVGTRTSSGVREDDLTAEEEADIQERLRGLGYL